MKVLKSPKAMRSWLKGVRSGRIAGRGASLAGSNQLVGRGRRFDPTPSAGLIIALVPTMGALHEAHLKLVRAARRAAQRVVVSIFVNPLQFGPKEDFKKYPRPLRRDLELLRREGVDAVFMPTPESFTPAAIKTLVSVKELSDALCGRSRPGHFDGVCTIVLKLFNAVQPDVAFFGKKDFQQQAIIKKMVGDLNVPVEIRTIPLIRERDGLAMSSRNVYLSAAERQSALAISRSLSAAAARIKKGERSAALLKKAIESQLKKAGLRIDYVSICDPATLKDVKQLKGNALIAIAVFAGTTRLIDNVEVRTK